MKRSVIYDILSFIFLAIALIAFSIAVYAWIYINHFTAVFLAIMATVFTHTSIAFTKLAIVTSKK